MGREARFDADSPFAGKIDTSRLGIAGHSYGAFTVLQIAGMRTPDGIKAPDPRIRAVLALSPPEPHFDSPEDFTAITAPTFLFTGTKDAAVQLGPIEKRLINYTSITRAPAWLVVLEGGDHLVYSGTGPKWATPEAAAHYPEWRACITDMAVALFRAELLDDASAKAALTREAVTRRVGALGTVSVK